jgi:hypothetical protein
MIGDFPNSLGFKQLARGLHAGFVKALICRGVACGERHHRNKLEP